MPKFHKASILGPGPRVVLDREQRAQFRAKMKLQRRPGRLSLGAMAVGDALVGMLGPDGRLDPCHETLAELARVSISTVKRALAKLEAFGFLTWCRRLGRHGARVAQTSNAYALTVPATEVHFERGVGLSDSKKEAVEQGGGWQRQCDSAAQQMLALGFAVPAVWGACGVAV